MAFRVRITEEFYPYNAEEVRPVADIVFDEIDVTRAVQGAVDASNRARWTREERERHDRAHGLVRIPAQVQDAVEVPPVPVPDFEEEPDGPREVCGRTFPDKHGQLAFCEKRKGHDADCVGSPIAAVMAAPEA